MKNDYYFALVMGLIAQYPAFQNIVESTCPTRWFDGSTCSPADDTMNKAFMETEVIMEILDSTMCLYCDEHTCDPNYCDHYENGRCPSALAWNSGCYM